MLKRTQRRTFLGGDAGEGERKACVLDRRNLHAPSVREHTITKINTTMLLLALL